MDEQLHYIYLTFCRETCGRYLIFKSDPEETTWRQLGPEHESSNLHQAVGINDLTARVAKMHAGMKGYRMCHI